MASTNQKPSTAAALPSQTQADLTGSHRLADSARTLGNPRPHKITTEVVNIGPRMAAELLRRNTSNRRISRRTVAQYARDMKAGRWMLNGEPIQIAVDGTLLNGQHRLHAIIAAEVTIPMLLITGLPLEAQATMDAGRKRSPVDQFGLQGERHAKAIAAIARRVALWERGDRRFRDVVSFPEMAELLERYPEIRRSAEIAERVHRSFRPLSISVLGTSHFLLNRKSPADAPWFFGAIESGAGLEEGNPVLTLRERIRSDRDQGVHVDDVRAIGYVVRAWNAYRKGKKLSRLVHAKGEPIPDIL